MSNYNGKRLAVEGGNGIYVVINGVAQLIPSVATYNNIFGNHDQTSITKAELDTLPQWDALDEGAYLARVEDSQAVYLVSNKIKRLVVSPEVMATYAFDWTKVKVVSGADATQLDALPSGPPISDTITDYDYKRVRLDGSDAIYVVINGIAELIPNVPTYQGIFANEGAANQTQVTKAELDTIPQGSPLENGAYLARAKNTAPIYLVSNGMKRRVSTPNTMRLYSFDWDKIHSGDKAAKLGSMVEGPTIW
ncbi:MAG TPA: hypothetical protein DCE41_05980 [Cytophagales bacterium]|nr:hypothetical protein [Cytophagales bacterium]HAA21983.1 hypothetical protein [Cytophagales bacterium]HAP63794.1 hypothetical protein [Cytophagales bacterium]